MEKSKKKLQEFAVPHPPISKLFSCKPAVKNIDVGGKGGPEKEIFISNDSFATIYGKDCRSLYVGIYF